MPRSKAVVTGGGTTTGFEVVGGSGVWLETAGGARVIDCTAQSWVYNLGFAHPKIVACLQDNASSLIHVHTGLDTAPRNALAEALCALLPKPFTSCSFTTTGALAIESAMKLASLTTGRTEFAFLFDGFHGTSLGTINASWITSLSRGDRTGASELADLGPRYIKTPNCYCYRCCFNKKPATCEIECATWFDTTVRKAAQGPIAALIVEPVQGNGGQIIARKEFLKTLRAICDHHGIILIFDEAQTFCRIGNYSAAQVFDVNPDIIVLSKSIGAGLPLACVLFTDRVKRFRSDLEDIHTFGNSALAQRLSLRQLEIIEEEGILQNVKDRGEELRQALGKINHPAIGDIRQIGLHIGVEMVEDRGTGRPWSIGKTKEFRAKCFENGIVVGAGGSNFNVIKIKPPLIITKEECGKVISAFSEALGKFG